MDKKIVQSTKWSGITELLSKIITPFINLFLARILTPEVFGVVATFTLVITFAEVFTDAGFQKYLVQHEFEDDEDRINSTNVAFWTNFIFSCVVWLIILIFRDPIASLVGSPGYGWEIVIVGLNIPMVALSSIQAALYRRDFKFKQLLPIRVITCAVPLVVTLPLALVLRNCWALIIGTLAKEAVYMLSLSIKSDWRPKWYYSFAKLKEMLSFSATMMADSFMIWFTSYAGTFIVSQYLTTYYIGIYKTGITTISTYMNLIYTITAPVFFAALSRAQKDKHECDRLYYSFQRYCALIVIPLGFGAFVFRDFVTQILLGDQWGEASLMIGLVALALAYTILTAQFNSDYFRSQGKPKIALLVQSIYAAAMAMVLPVAVQRPFDILCISRFFLILFYAVVSTVVICLRFKVSLATILHNLLYPTVAAVIMSGVGMLLRQVSTSFVWNIVSILICAIVYLLVILLIPRTRKDLLALKHGALK